MYSCVRCEKIFNNKTDIERHINNTNQICVSKLKYNILNSKDEKFLSLLKISERDSLINNNNKEDENICNYCSVKFENKKNCNRHMKTCGLKNNFEYLKNICLTYNDIKKENINLLKIYDINGFDDNYYDSYLTIDEKIGILFRLEPCYVIDKLFLNKKNINILPINDFMSCIIVSEKNTKQKIIKKINNNLLKDILVFKIKNYMENLNKYFLDFKIIHLYSYNFYSEKIKQIFLQLNLKSIIFEKVIYLIKKKNIEELNYFVSDFNLNLDSFQKIKDYYENIQIDFLNELYGFEDEELFDNFGNKIEYSTNGKHAIFDYLWK